MRPSLRAIDAPLPGGPATVMPSLDHRPHILNNPSVSPSKRSSHSEYPHARSAQGFHSRPTRSKAAFTTSKKRQSPNYAASTTPPSGSANSYKQRMHSRRSGTPSQPSEPYIEVTLLAARPISPRTLTIGYCNSPCNNRTVPSRRWSTPLPLPTVTPIR
jgi:hypothetical protein